MKGDNYYESKKMISMILIGITAISMLVGCGSDTSKTKESKTESAAQDKREDSSANEEKEDASANETKKDSGKTLVVYYSATGNTKSVAETIAQITDGELFEIEPKEPYTDADLDWTNNDFTGKTVIPFCTAASSEIGESGKLLEEMAGTGDWKEGERFHGGASESDIRIWINRLGL